MSLKHFLPVVACGAVLLSQCFDKTTGTGGNSQTQPGYFKLMALTYSVTGTNQLTVLQSRQKCTDSILVSYTDTTKSIFTIKNDSLFDIDTSTNPYDTTAYVRIGNGAGLQGTWMVQESGDTGKMIISTATIDYYVKPLMVLAVAKYEFMDLASPGVVIDTSMPDRMTFSGVTTKEVVTLTITSTGALRWSSSSPANAAAICDILSDPTSCPESGVDSPDWFLAFIGANSTGTFKSISNVPFLKLTPESLFGL